MIKVEYDEVVKPVKSVVVSIADKHWLKLKVEKDGNSQIFISILSENNISMSNARVLLNAENWDELVDVVSKMNLQRKEEIENTHK